MERSLLGGIGERDRSDATFARPAMRPREDELTGTQKHAFLHTGRPHVVAMWPGGTIAKELPDGGKLTVGRSRGCDLTIDHGSVSREHVAFHGVRPVEVEDLGSTNGTTVGGVTDPEGDPRAHRARAGRRRRRGRSGRPRRVRTSSSRSRRAAPHRRRGRTNRRSSSPTTGCASSIASSISSPKGTCRSSCSERPAPEKTSWPTRFIVAPRDRSARTCASIAPRFPTTSSRASSLDTSAARSRAPCRRSRASSRSPTAVACSSTRLRSSR